MPQFNEACAPGARKGGGEVGPGMKTGHAAWKSPGCLLQDAHSPDGPSQGWIPLSPSPQARRRLTDGTFSRYRDVRCTALELV